MLLCCIQYKKVEKWSKAAQQDIANIKANAADEKHREKKEEEDETHRSQDRMEDDANEMKDLLKEAEAHYDEKKEHLQVIILSFIQFYKILRFITFLYNLIQVVLICFDY